MNSYFQKKRVLITGGMGFLGSNLAHRLVDLGAEILLVDSLIPEHGGNRFNISGIEDRVQVCSLDVRDDNFFPQLVQGQDYLFNLAAQTSHLGSMRDPYTDLDINVRSQISILEACRHYNPHLKIVFASTRQVYGKPDYLPVDERHPLHPVDVNGINKASGEWYHLLYNSVYGIKTCILRMTNTYGPRMRVKDASQNFLGIWIRLLVEGKPLEVWGGKQKRDFTYVDDAVEAFLLAASNANANGKVFNLGGDRAVSLKELADLLIDINGRGHYVIREFPQDRERIDIGDYYADYTRAQTVLRWEPKIPLRKGLACTLAYYKQHRDEYWKNSE